MNKNTNALGQFVKGNTIGNRFKPANGLGGRPHGSRNLMSVVRDLANTKEPGKPLNRFATLVINAIDTNKKMSNLIKNMDEEDPSYKKNLESYQKSCTDLADFLLKSSGDFSTTVKTESDEKQREFSSICVVDGEEVTVLK